MVTRKSEISKLRAHLAGWGISGLALLGGVVYAGRTTEQKVIRPYVQTIAREQFDSLQAPYIQTLNDVCYDSKLTRNIMELSVSDSVFAKAKRKTDDTTWKVR